MTTPHLWCDLWQSWARLQGQGRNVNNRARLMQSNPIWVKHYHTVCSRAHQPRATSEHQFPIFPDTTAIWSRETCTQINPEKKWIQPCLMIVKHSPHCLEEQKGDFDKLKSEAICQLFPLFLPLWLFVCLLDGRGKFIICPRLKMESCSKP